MIKILDIIYFNLKNKILKNIKLPLENRENLLYYSTSTIYRYKYLNSQTLL